MIINDENAIPEKGDIIEDVCSYTPTVYMLKFKSGKSVAVKIYKEDESGKMIKED